MVNREIIIFSAEIEKEQRIFKNRENARYCPFEDSNPSMKPSLSMFLDQAEISEQCSEYTKTEYLVFFLLSSQTVCFGVGLEAKLKIMLTVFKESVFYRGTGVRDY
jgi:hypothetical protein